MMKTKKKNVFIILLLIIVVLPILLSFVKCDNGNSEMDPSTTIQEELKSSKRLNKARAISGTPVPNSGTCPDVYLNLDLSVNEVEEILNTIDYIEMEGESLYWFLYGEYYLGAVPSQVNIIISKADNDYGIIFILGSEQDASTEILFSSDEGWNNNFDNGVIMFSSLDISLYNNNPAFNIPVGEQNNKLSKLFSTTPFIQDNRSGLQIIFEEIGSGLIELATAFINLFIGLVPVFWVNNQPTIITIIVLAGVVLNIGFWGIDKLLKLFKIGLGGKK